MTSDSTYIKLGIFVTAGIILFIIGIYNIGNRQSMFQSTIPISSVFANVQGLQPGNNVRYAGINIGNIESITFLNDTSVRVDMLLSSDAATHISKDAIATISSDGLVGNMILSIDPGQRKLDKIKPGDFITSYSRISSNDMLNTLNVTNENAAMLTSDLLEITQRILHKEGTMRLLLSDTSLTNNIQRIANNIKTATESFSETSKQLASLSQKLNDGNGLIGLLSEDTLNAHRIESLIVNLEKTSNQLKNTSGVINDYVNNIDDSEGTINALVNDSIMANDLKESLRNINSASSRFNENMEAMKHNFLFKKYFKKKAKGKIKPEVDTGSSSLNYLKYDVGSINK